MKLTDIMFSLEYIGANVGADVTSNGGEVFVYDEVTTTAANEEVTFNDAIAMSGTKPVIWVALKGSSAKKVAIEEGTTAHKFVIPTAGTYCVMYRKTNSTADKVTISAQFIPKTLHAVLTVALYSGDACNAESATKAGEVVIDIPRFQLSGAMDLSMTATGASQTALDGQALASGCTSCDGTGIYATITRVITSANWYDEAQGLVIEDLTGLTAGQEKVVTVYAYYTDKAPRKLAASEWTLAKVEGAGTVTDATKTITAAAGTTVISATAKDSTGTAISTLVTNKAIIVA